MKVILRNNFHGTEVMLNVRADYITPEQAKRAKRQLCGTSGCTCSSGLGVRGGIYDTDGRTYTAEQCQDGSWSLVRPQGQEED
jgi:hypothetical protein